MNCHINIAYQRNVKSIINYFIFDQWWLPDILQRPLPTSYSYHLLELANHIGQFASGMHQLITKRVFLPEKDEVGQRHLSVQQNWLVTFAD